MPDLPHRNDDAALLASARSGDLDAFAEFVRRYEHRVRAVLFRLLDDPRDVEEAAQDCFVNAWRNLDRFRAESTVFTWLYRIAVNEALARRRRKRLPLVEVEASERRPWLVGDRADEPQDAAERDEVHAFLAARIRALPLEARAPLVLRDLLGLSNREVADVLEISVPAAKSRIHRARMQIREELDRWEGGSESLP
jgi:RNA polymerase sigma-70 factor (ECF subfamily)